MDGEGEVGELGGGRGHEGRGGKWQPLGPRPQLMLLVQPHPGGEISLLHFSWVAEWVRAGGRNEVKKCLQVWGVLHHRAPLPPKFALPAAVLGTLASPHPTSPQGPGFRGLGSDMERRLLCAPPGRGRALVEGGKADLWPERLAWVLFPPTAFSYPVGPPRGGHPGREQDVRSGNLVWQKPTATTAGGLMVGPEPVAGFLLQQ